MGRLGVFIGMGCPCRDPGTAGELEVTVPTSHAGEPVSIVVINWNGGTMLLDCLESVIRQGTERREIILVDNASTDGSDRDAERRFPMLRVTRNAANAGFAAACNQGVALAAYDLVVLLNNDTVVEPGWIEGLEEMLRSGRYGVVTSRVVTDGVPAQYYAMNGSLNYAGYNIMRVFADLSQVFFAGGGSLMFRRSVVGLPFPEAYFLYHEDVHLSWRMRLTGHGVGMAQTSVVRHRGSVSAKRQPGALTTYYQERNRLLNALLFYEWWTLWKLVPYFVADALAKLTLSILTGRKSTAGIARAYWWIATHPGLVGAWRRELQQSRTVPDADILRWMSCRILEGGGKLPSMANGVSRWYARLVKLAHYD
jgi:N-acetylglucosaminyl-diphospho-decaprenol L-rhamnosyltransferase